MRFVIVPVTIQVLGVPSVEKTRSIELIAFKLICGDEAMSVGDID